MKRWITFYPTWGFRFLIVSDCYFESRWSLEFTIIFGMFRIYLPFKGETDRLKARKYGIIFVWNY